MYTHIYVCMYVYIYIYIYGLRVKEIGPIDVDMRICTNTSVKHTVSCMPHGHEGLEAYVFYNRL